jgi:hypothetical protein
MPINIHAVTLRTAAMHEYNNLDQFIDDAFSFAVESENFRDNIKSSSINLLIYFREIIIDLGN